MNNYHKILLFIIMLCVTVTTHAASKLDEDAGLEDNLSFYLYDDIDLISTLKFEYGKPRIIIKAVFPQLASDTDRKEVIAFNDLSTNIVKEEVQFYRGQIKMQMPKKQTPTDNKLSNNFYVDYNSAYLRAKKENILSVRFTLQAYIGAQNNIYSKHRSLNYNLTTMQEMSLSDLFKQNSPYLNVLAQYSRQLLSKTLKQKELIDSGTVPDPENYKIWNLNVDGLLLTFEDGQVAPKGYGTQTVLVPYHVFANLLSENTSLTDCFTNKYRCFRGHLVTGGFIDEA